MSDSKNKIRASYTTNFLRWVIGNNGYALAIVSAESNEMNGFISATSTYLEEFKDRYNIDFELEIDNFNVELNAQQSLTFYRILQEALSNVAKHSMAKQLVFSIYNDNDSVYMDIVDNGVGFDMESNTMRQDSYGMLGMQERVVLLGGELNVNSELGKGTKVSVSIPINNIKVES